MSKNYKLKTTNCIRVIAVDPGYERLGVAVLERSSAQPKLLFSICLQTKKGKFEERLQQLGTAFDKLIVEWKPGVFAVEKLFFAANQKTAMGVSEVKGMLSYIAATHKLEYHEFTPLQVKIAVASYGRADKRQVIDMLHRLVRIEKPIRYDDEYDAIAIGLTCLASYR